MASASSSRVKVPQPDPRQLEYVKSRPSSGFVSWTMVIDGDWSVNVHVTFWPAVNVMVTRRLVRSLVTPLLLEQESEVRVQPGTRSWVIV